ncbi:DUF5677 domain-containing protein [Burkholderia cepacia]|uniref:DUF5677 domain-containing protein n=1 Tax=Burkholderia cepacia TaxID=292 RepID=UPI000A7674E2|nr:DUF5677 domain-containing protein [Burkholderia cepacia]
MNIQQLLDTCNDLLEDFQRLVRGATLPAAGPDNVRIRLTLTIAEQFEAALKLTSAHMSTHAATHVRSMIEARVTMKMLEVETDYIKQLHYEQLRGEKRVYESILADPLIPEDAKLPIRDRLAACKPQFDDLHAAGLRPKRIADDFGSTGLSHFVGPYVMLCNFAHNDLSALLFRHGGVGKIVYKDDDSPQLVQSIFACAVHVLMEATYQLGEIAKLPNGQFESVFTEMNAKWHHILDNPVVQGME